MTLRRQTGGWTAGIYTRGIAATLCAALTLGIAGCAGSGDAPAAGSQTTYGSPSAVGDGTARSYITRDANGVPTAVGVEITEGARANLPVSPPPTFAKEYILDTASQLAATPFTGVSIYYTAGHPPAEVYEKPHYHPIFYLAPAAERAGILFNGDPGAAPPASAVPAGYVSEHFVLPGLGDVYASPTNPATQSLPFNSTDYDFGYFNGKMSSINLTVTQDWLNLHGKVTYPIAQPQTYRTSGYYPTTYTVEYDPNTQVYRFSLGNFVNR